MSAEQTPIPTHVFGQGAREYAAAKGWTAATIIEGGMLNYPKGPAGTTPENARHIVVTPGAYGPDVEFGLGPKRSYVTIEGAPEGRPVLFANGQSSLGLGLASELKIRNLELSATPILWIQNETTPCNVEIGPGVFQHGVIRNGVFNGGRRTKFPQLTYIHDAEFDGNGSYGNTMHGMYLEARPDHRLVIEDCEFYGGRGCTQVKTALMTVEIRRNKFFTKSRKNPADTAGSMISLIPPTKGCIIADNEFEMWRNPDPAANNKPSYVVPHGLYNPPIHRQNRRTMVGCDMPAYPDVSWDPPVSSFGGNDPGGGWSPKCETYVDDAFWAEVEAGWAQPETSPFTFPCYISGNLFRVTAGSRPCLWLRDNGTLPFAAPYQFATSNIARRAPARFHERSVTFYALNRFEGEVIRKPDMRPRRGIRQRDRGGRNLPGDLATALPACHRSDGSRVA